ncbi:hypothetical protein [Pelagivirga sediminicola]
MVWTPADDNAPIYFRFYDPRSCLIWSARWARAIGRASARRTHPWRRRFRRNRSCRAIAGCRRLAICLIRRTAIRAGSRASPAGPARSRLQHSGWTPPNSTGSRRCTWRNPSGRWRCRCMRRWAAFTQGQVPARRSGGLRCRA